MHMLGKEDQKKLLFMFSKSKNTHLIKKELGLTLDDDLQ